MKKIIASVKLAPGNRGFFDPLTGINLKSNKLGYIYEGDDVTNIRKAIRESKLKIVGGKIPPAINIKPKTKPVCKEKEEPVIIEESIEIEQIETLKEEKMIEELEEKIEELEEKIEELEDPLEEGE